MENIFCDKTILVTGGAGSIGKEIVKQVLKFGPKKIRIFNRDDTEQMTLKHELNNDSLRFFIGDIRDRERVRMAMNGADIVFHTAALKHVDMCEYNPFEAVKTNVMGTQNVIDAAINANVEKFITISTDKVVNTINTLGATKLLAERLTIAGNFYKGESRSLLSCVRFGNVLDSRGSVLSIFKKQALNDHHITVTNPDMTRFIMSVSQAVGLILKAAKLMEGGEIFILKMPALRIGDLAEVIADYHGGKEIKHIGIRPGERMHENLISDIEANGLIDHDDIFVLLPYLRSKNMEMKRYVGMKKLDIESYRSNDVKLLTKEEIKDFLLRENML